MAADCSSGTVEFRGLVLASEEPRGDLDAAWDPTYLQLWQRATDALCGWFASAPDVLRGASCALELGAGLGAAGMFAATLGCPSVQLTDHPVALGQLRANVARNNLSARCSVAALDWSEARRVDEPSRWPLIFGNEHPVDVKQSAIIAVDLKGVVAV